LFAALDRAVDHGNRTQRDRERGQPHLFEGDAGGSTNGETFGLPDVAAWSDAQCLRFEKESLGLYLTGHPVADYDEDLRAIGALGLGDLSESMADVSVGGVVEGTRLLRTRRGDSMATFTLSDAHGSLEVVVFPETFAKCAKLIANDTMVLTRGKLEKDDETARLLATEVVPLEHARERSTTAVAIRLAVPPHGRETFETLANVFARYRGDRPVRIELEVRRDGRPMRVRADVQQVRVRPTAELIAELERICGEGTVELQRARRA
jgi:DNA polymerase-3 subunit alpha